MRWLSPLRAGIRRIPVFVVVLAVAGPIRADDEPRAERFEPDARLLYEEVVAAYKALPAYVAEGELSVAWKTRGEWRRFKVPMSVTFVRPDRGVLVNGPLKLISDGKTLTTVFEPFGKFARSEAPRPLGIDGLKGNPALAPLLSGPTGFPMFVLVELLTDPDASRLLCFGARGMLLEPDRTQDGRALKALFLDWPMGSDFRMLVDPKTKLVARIEMVHALGVFNEELPPEQRASELEIAWTAKTTRTRAPDPKAFAFAPPEGFAQVALDQVLERPLLPGEIRMPPEVDARVKAEMEASGAMVGHPAPEFQVEVLDGPGRTRTIRKADLAGRVVVLVFWPASLEGVLFEELLQVQALPAAYADSREKLVFLFFLHDNVPQDPATIRPQVEALLQEKKLKLPRGDIGRVALDPTLAVSRAFHVRALPGIALLDGRGTVRAVHSGLHPENRAVLIRQIDALLAGKEPPHPQPFDR